MKIKKIESNQKGFSVLLITFLVLIIGAGVILNILVLTLNEEKILQNTKTTDQVFYTAEAGLEDAILKLKKGTPFSSPYSLAIDGAVSTITIFDVIGGARTIISEGNYLGRTRKAKAVYKISSTEAQFFYGAQVGAEGLILENLSQITGNIFSDGNIEIKPGAKITGTATAAGAGKKIFGGGLVSQNAVADICENTTISGELRTNSQINCTYGSLATLGVPPSTVPLPISAAAIDEWKTEAGSGGTISGIYKLDGSNTASIGPKKIAGDLIIQNNAVLTLTGSLWVTGNIFIKDNAVVQLSAAAYGTLSGMIIADGIVTLQNNSISRGSGQTGSYLMYLSTAAGLTPAIAIKNNSIVDILYTSNGLISVDNNAQIREVTAYGLRLGNNASLVYELGMQNTFFTSGPSAGWVVADWGEIQ